MLKRGKIALLSLTLMLLIAGYINYKYNPEREKNLGKTIYVNGKDSYMYENVSIYNEEESSISNVEEKSNVTGNSNSNEDAISVFRYDRDNMYSELEENYRSTISNTNTSKEKINDYQDKLNKLIEEKNLISMVENVILSKGIEDIVIIPTSNNNLNVVIKSKEEIPSDLMAKIQQIIVDQLGVEASKISIIRQN
ncbi:putative uncharacterized protein [Clostridium sp. CAG:1219]|nr:putative uncharacterized protein [Clostridium sp. CAG:1219]